MPAKTITQTVNTLDQDEAGIRFYRADASSEHPGALVAEVTLRSGETKTIFLQNLVNGSLAPAAPFNGAQLTSARVFLRAVFAAAAAAAGYT